MIQQKHIATVATLNLKNGVKSKDKRLILMAYAQIEDDGFSWDYVPDRFFKRWDKLVDKANDILNE